MNNDTLFASPILAGIREDFLEGNINDWFAFHQLLSVAPGEMPVTNERGPNPYTFMLWAASLMSRLQDEKEQSSP